MGELVSLQEARESREPHNCGKARCTACGHEQISVAPAGVIWLECSACHTNRALFIEHLERAEGEHFICECGSFIYAIHETAGLYCISCGLGHSIDIIPEVPTP